MLTKEDALFEFVGFAQRNLKPLAFNLSAHYVINAHNSKINKIIETADFVFCNEDEARVYAEVNKIEHVNLLQVAVAISQMPSRQGRTVVVT